MRIPLLLLALFSGLSRAGAQQTLTQEIAPQTAAPTVAQRLAKDLTWSGAERENRFAHMDRVFPVNRIRASAPRRLLVGKSLRIALANGESLHHRMVRDRLAGVLVLQGGHIRLESFALHASQRTAWTTFSVTKSVTATLVGYALQDGSIHSADDAVTRYIPELRGSAYDGVTVRQLAAMTSGVRWVEDYTAPDSDNVKLYAMPVEPGSDQVVDYMRRLPREAAPGTKFIYKTGETDLLGVLVRRAVGMSLSAYTQQTLWRDIGAQSGAFWIADGGKEFGGSGLSATLEDLARLGEFVRTHRVATSPLGDWLATSTVAAADSGRYGLGWWTYPDGSFAALGIFGQSILVDPARDLVVVTIGAWPEATSPELVVDREALWKAVRHAADISRPDRDRSGRPYPW